MGRDTHDVLVRHDLFLHPRFVGGQHSRLRRFAPVLTRLLPFQIRKPDCHRRGNDIPPPPRKPVRWEMDSRQGDPGGRVLHWYSGFGHVRGTVGQILEGYHIRDAFGVMDLRCARIQPVDDVHLEFVEQETPR